MSRVMFWFKVMALASIYFVLPVSAQGLIVLTENNPPSSFIGPDGKPTGYGVEIVSEIQKRLKIQDKIEIYPWARAYHTIVNKSGVVVFTMVRTKEREPLFQWVGPILEHDWILIGKKTSNLKLTSFEDGKKLRSIGVVRGYASDKYLTSQGFTNLQRLSDYSTMVKMLERQRIPVLVSSSMTYKSEIIEQGLKPEDFEVLIKFKTVQLYIAHSKANNKEMVAAWQQAFDAMKKDGTVTKLMAKWLPAELKMPGPAKPASF